MSDIHEINNKLATLRLETELSKNDIFIIKKDIEHIHIKCSQFLKIGDFMNRWEMLDETIKLNRQESLDLIKELKDNINGLKTELMTIIKDFKVEISDMINSNRQRRWKATDWIIVIVLSIPAWISMIIVLLSRGSGG